MTDHILALVAAYQACGAEAEALPESDAETLELGRRLTSGKECYPLILTTGDLAKLVKRPDFNPDNSAFFMPNASGPCRFGQYNRYQRLVLDELGYPQVTVYAPDQDVTMYEELGMVGEDFDRIAWNGFVAIDLLEKKLWETRPYERHVGETDKVYQHFLRKTYEALRDRGDLVRVLGEACQTLNEMALIGPREKPIVGVVGEIYVRSNRFANEDAVREIEALGGEVLMPPISEWLLYVNYTTKKRALNSRRYRYYATVLLKEFFQHRAEHRLGEIFQGSLRNLKEPSITRTIDMASGYLHPSFEGEAILSLGKSIDFINKGASGLVNIMPFTCMPGTVVNSLMGRFREEHDHIPFLNLAYDGQEQTHTRTRLEAFMYQVRQFQNRSHPKRLK